uniref:Methyltransferase type 11 n=1 Tax=Cyanothece sp. (strain PCC 7425 / ATCC 29141) TaxID=395961 RepID=B8HML5_CYAP4
MNRMVKRSLRVIGLALAIAAVLIIGTRFYQSWALDREAERLGELLNLKPGAIVAEIGAGNGDMAVRIAKQIQPGGLLYATELDTEELERIRANVSKHGLTNVQVIQGAVDGTGLPEDCCNAIFMRHVYHHFSLPEQMNDSMGQALRPGALLAVIDFPPDWLLSTFAPLNYVPANRGGHGIRHELLVEELNRDGFKFVQLINGWDGNQYLVLVRKAA